MACFSLHQVHRWSTSFPGLHILSFKHGWCHAYAVHSYCQWHYFAWDLCLHLCPKKILIDWITMLLKHILHPNVYKLELCLKYWSNGIISCCTWCWCSDYSFKYTLWSSPSQVTGWQCSLALMKLNSGVVGTEVQRWRRWLFPIYSLCLSAAVQTFQTTVSLFCAVNPAKFF